MKIIKTETGEFEYYNNEDMMAILKADWAKAAAEGNETIGIMAKHILADKPDKNAAKNAAAEIIDLIQHNVNQRAIRGVNNS